MLKRAGFRILRVHSDRYVVSNCWTSLDQERGAPSGRKDTSAVPLGKPRKSHILGMFEYMLQRRTFGPKGRSNRWVKKTE